GRIVWMLCRPSRRPTSRIATVDGNREVAVFIAASWAVGPGRVCRLAECEWAFSSTPSIGGHCAIAAAVWERRASRLEKAGRRGFPIRDVRGGDRRSNRDAVVATLEVVPIVIWKNIMSLYALD